ncbi:hypothetical protein RclHR1_00050024 [Rhizophagus clarus]|uniref:Cell wall protein IFF6-like n=1 Tax=Rhizophagus clarus TaxID=94130 RepID=A0A2Z6RK58_9GLOM|nr:hypothetical protein RclHR1_00050024 [Rhizophagus clarus]GES86187.1 cell wall protein IFF6-like [Rhizophagus clarus]
MGKSTTTKAPKVARQRKTRTEKNERRKNKRIEKQMNSTKPPRSPNRFILYRKHVQNKLNTDPNNPANMRDLSKMVAQMWEKESADVKQYWDQVAERIKLNSSYRSTFDVINGLDMSISESDITFVNATASVPKSTKSKKNRKNKSHTPSNTFNPTISSESFIIESPELNIPPIPPSNPNNPQWPLSPQSSQFPQSPLPQSPLSLESPQSPLSPLSPLSPQFSQFSIFPQPSILSQFPPTPQSPQSPQYQQYPQSPQPLHYLQSPPLSTDEDPSLVSSPPPSNDDDFSYPNYDSQEMQMFSYPTYYLPPLFGVDSEYFIEPDYHFVQAQSP